MEIMTNRCIILKENELSSELSCFSPSLDIYVLLE